MSLHPALAAVVAADVLASAAAAWAIAGALRVAAGWSPGAATAEQLSLERKAEEVSIAGRTALALALPGTLLLLVAINHVLPALVPGAMCGMGVLDAMPDGRATLALRVTSLVALWAWGTLDALDRRDRLGPLAPRTARGILAAGGLLLASTLRTTSSLVDLDVHAPVSCCAATLDLARAAGGPRAVWLAGPWHALVLVVTGLLLAGWALRGQAARRAGLLLGGLVAWALFAEWVLVDVTAPYHYGLLGHRCPFCLFSRQQFFVGWLVHGALLVAILEGAALAVANRAASLEGAARRSGRAGRIIAVAVALHLVASLLPVLLHRLRTGAFLT